MEDPATWGRAEAVVEEALTRAAKLERQQFTGLSTARQVTDALREAGLLLES